MRFSSRHTCVKLNGMVNRRDSRLSPSVTTTHYISHIMNMVKIKRCWLLLLPVIIYLVIWTCMGKIVCTQDRNTGSDHRTRTTRRTVTPVKRPEVLGVGQAVEINSISTHAPGVDFNRALVSGKKAKNKKIMTIAIPSISRPKGIRYLEKTLDSLIENSSERERKGLIIVVFLADFNHTARINLNDKLLKKYPKHFDSGLIQTISAPLSYYPDMTSLKSTYGHKMEQVKWRAKQNFDYAYMMEYSKNLTLYYLQLEDDVTTVPNYIKIINDYMGQFPEWTCLEFCELGFIAKLYHTEDLPKLAQLLKIFFNEQPNDVLYLHFNEIMLQYRRFVRRPTIFQHKGIISSLGLKGAVLQDILFDEKTKTELKAPKLPVEIRQIGRVAGPEYAVWVKRKQDEKQLHKKIRLSPYNFGQ